MAHWTFGLGLISLGVMGNADWHKQDKDHGQIQLGEGLHQIHASTSNGSIEVSILHKS